MLKINFKKIYAVLLVLSLISNLILPIDVRAEDTSGFAGSGEGTDSDPYIITTAEELNQVRNEPGAYYRLDADIDMSGYDWEPIGSEQEPFTGSLDGNGHIISNLSINKSVDFDLTEETTVNLGMFGNISNAAVENLGIENADYNVTVDDYEGEDVPIIALGGIAGAADASEISQCYFTGAINNEAPGKILVRSAPIACIVTGSSNITDCYSNCATYAKSDSGNTMAAGVAAWLDNSTVENCYVMGTVTAENTNGYVYIGGINASGGSGKVLNCACMLEERLASGYSCYNDVIGNFSTQSGNIELDPEGSQAKDKSTYTDLGWDFESIWTIDAGYPTLMVYGGSADDEDGGSDEETEKDNTYTGDASSGDASLKLGNDIEFTIPDSVPIIGGGKVALDFGNIPIQFEREGNTYRLGIGVSDLSKFDEEGWTSFKKFVETQKESYSRGINSLLASRFGTASMGWTVKPEIKCYGYAEGVITGEGIQSCSGKVMIQVAVKANKEWQTTVVVVPVVIKASGKVGIKTTASVGLDFENASVYTDGSLELTLPEIKLSAGVGVAYVADISVYGKAANKITISRSSLSTAESVKGELSGELGASAKVLFITYEKPLLSGTWTYYNSTGTAKATASDGSAAIDLTGEYSINRTESAWYGESVSSVTARSVGNTDVTTLADDIYNASEPALLETENGTRVIIYTADIAERTTGSHTAIVYSVYDDEQGTWSEPVIIDDDGTADFYPSAAADGNKIIVAWSNCNRGFTSEDTEDADFISALAGSLEIETARIDIESGDISAETLTADGYMDTYPDVAVKDGEIYISWYKNSGNDALELGGTNSIYRAVENNGAWDVLLLDEAEAPVTSIASGYLDGGFATAYIIADDSEGSRKITVSDAVGNTAEAADDASCMNLQFGSIGGEDALLWYTVDDEAVGAVNYIVSAGGNVETLLEYENLSSDYSIVNGDTDSILVFSAAEDEGSSIYAGVISDGSAGSPVALTDLEGYSASPSGLSVDGGYLIAFVRTDAAVSETAVTEETSLCIASISAEGDLSIQDMAYDEDGMTAGAEAEIDVTVKNNGLSSCDVGSIEMVNGSDIMGSISVADEMGTGEENTYTFTATLPQDVALDDVYTVYVRSGSGDILAEADIQPGFIDLELSYEQSADGGYTLTVRNNSSIDTDAQLSVYDTDSTGELLASWSLGTVEGSGTVQKTFTEDELRELGDCLYVWAGADDDAQELLADNNGAFIYAGDDTLKSLDHLEAVKECVRYSVGDEISLGDLAVTAVYDDGSTEAVTDYTTNISEIDMQSAGEKTLQIKYEETYTVRTVLIGINVGEKAQGVAEGTDSGGGNGSTGGTAVNGSVSNDGASAAAKGSFHSLGGLRYKITDAATDGTGTVALAGIVTKKAAVRIPDTVTIGGHTYKVTSIANNAFKNNKKITSLVIGKNVRTIGANAFSGCTKLKKATIRSTALVSIGKKAFSGCRKLADITIRSKSLRKIGKQALKGINAKCVIKVPKAKKAAYSKLFKGKGQKATVKIR